MNAPVIASRCSGIYYVPVLHHCLEFACLVGQAFKELAPKAVAVELPEILRPAIARGIRRLPRMSVIAYLYMDRRYYLLIHPADALVETLRLAGKENIPCHFIDAPVAKQAFARDRLPDAYLLRHRELSVYYALAAGAHVPDPIDTAREQYMAHRLQKLRQTTGAPLLVVTGLLHLQGIEERLDKRAVTPFLKGAIQDPVLYHLHPDSLGEVLSQYPLCETIYEMQRSPMPRPANETVNLPPARGTFRVLEGKISTFEEKRRAAKRMRKQLETPLDRSRLLALAVSESLRIYQHHTGEKVHAWQYDLLDRFLWKYTRLEGRLLPDLYQVLAAARSCIDDNFAFEAWSFFTWYPWQEDPADIPCLRVTSSDIYMNTRSIRLQRTLKRSLQRLKRFPLKKHAMETTPGQWSARYEPGAIVSFPPEDIRIEDWAGRVKNKLLGITGSEPNRSRPFVSSLGDGIDLRQTIRHLHDRQIYVYEKHRVPENVDALVLVFDPDETEQKFTYRLTWLGEHENESDMAFYSTPPTNHAVGPGIYRCEYGGLLMLYPCMQLYDVWSIPEYRLLTRKKHEILLMGALDYSHCREVVYIAAKPPSQRMGFIAARLQKRIRYLPLGVLSPDRLKAIRVFHILDDAGKRADAGKYIW